MADKIDNNLLKGGRCFTLGIRAKNTKGEYMGQLKVYEIRLKVYLLQDIPYERTYTVMSDYIDSCLAKDEKYRKLHETNQYKYYCFDNPYPTEKNGIYKKDQIYTVRIRAVDEELANYLGWNLANHYNNEVKGLTREIKLIPKKMISQVYTVTPAVIKNSDGDSKGYWKSFMSFDEFENRIKSNLIKKFNSIHGTKIDEDFDLYNQIELINKKPITVPYKGIKLLGDKFCIEVADNERAQSLVYMALGSGFCELNARGCGFVNYKYL